MSEDRFESVLNMIFACVLVISVAACTAIGANQDKVYQTTRGECGEVK